MKKSVFIALGLLCLLSACNKKRKFEHIRGVDLSDSYNASGGVLGSSDIGIKDSGIVLLAYPVPATSVQSLILKNKSGVTKSVEIKIVNAYFSNAPKVIPSTPWFQEQGIAGEKIDIENLGGKPEEVLFRNTFDLSGINSPHYTIDVSNFKEGFYRITVDVDGKREYWRSLWIFRK